MTSVASKVSCWCCAGRGGGAGKIGAKWTRVGKENGGGWLELGDAWGWGGGRGGKELAAVSSPSYSLHNTWRSWGGEIGGELDQQREEKRWKMVGDARGGGGGRKPAGAVSSSSCPFRSPQVVATFVFHERERRATHGYRAAKEGKEPIQPNSEGTGGRGLSIVGGLPRAWPKDSWHCDAIPWANI